MPRSVSPVTTRAESQSTPSAPTGAVQTLSTPLCGAIHARLVPFGEIRGLTRSGFPKRTRLGMSSAMRHAYHAGQGDQYYPQRDPAPTAGRVTSAKHVPVTGTGAGGALLVRGGHVVTMDPGTGDVPGGDVLVSGGTIAAVGAGLAAPAGTPHRGQP